MKFLYAYKTPDGVRHEGQISASSRESAFIALRHRGIKPIKVEPVGWMFAAGGGIKRRVVVISVLLTAFFVAICTWMVGHMQRKDASSRLVLAGHKELLDFREKIKIIISQCESVSRIFRFDQFKDPRKLSNLALHETLRTEADRGQTLLDLLRSQLQVIIADAEDAAGPKDSVLHDEIKGLNESALSAIEQIEERIDAASYIIELLEKDTNAWALDEGKNKIQFTDGSSQAEYDECVKILQFDLQ